MGSDLALGVQSVRQMGQNFSHERSYLKTELLCEKNDLFSIKSGSSWKVQTELRNVKTKAVAPFRNHITRGSYRGGRLWRRQGASKPYIYKSIDQGQALVSNWSILAAVQSMALGANYTFQYFEDMERHFNDHSVGFMETFKASFSGHQRTLHGFYHRGRGLIPTFYWLSEDGRLLMARYGLTMLVYNANPILEQQPSTTWTEAS